MPIQGTSCPDTALPVGYVRTFLLSPFVCVAVSLSHSFGRLPLSKLPQFKAFFPTAFLLGVLACGCVYLYITLVCLQNMCFRALLASSLCCMSSKIFEFSLFDVQRISHKYIQCSCKASISQLGFLYRVLCTAKVNIVLNKSTSECKQRKSAISDPKQVHP